LVINKNVDRRTRRRIRWTVFLLALVVLAIYVGVFLEQR